VGRIHDAIGLRSPNVVAWRVRATEAARSVGDPDLAGRLVEEELSLARAFGLPVAEAAALRVRAAVEGDATPLRHSPTPRRCSNTTRRLSSPGPPRPRDPPPAGR
jgi:hypothetical protein